MLQTTRERWLLTGVFFLAMAVSFFAGQISVQLPTSDNRDTPMVALGQTSAFVPTLQITSADKGVLSGVSNSKDLRVFVGGQMAVIREDGSLLLDTTGLTERMSGATEAGETASYPYVASKNSKLYHRVGSSAANRISPANKVYFQSKAEAESKGFQPGSGVE